MVSLYISREESSNEYFLSLILSISSKSVCIAKGVIPGDTPSPLIVNVFPEEVCPYANIVTLIPFIAVSISPLMDW